MDKKVPIEKNKDSQVNKCYSTKFSCSKVSVFVVFVNVNSYTSIRYWKNVFAKQEQHIPLSKLYLDIKNTAENCNKLIRLNNCLHG